MNNKARKSEALIGHAKSRTSCVVGKIRDAMRAIELDIEQNEGIYPVNGGRLTQAEVCRRAGIHKITLQGKTHRTTTREMINLWLKKVAKTLVTGKRVVRRTVTERADGWRDRYMAMARWIDLYHLEDAQRQQMLVMLKARISELEAENLGLRAELSDSKVVRLPNTSKKGPVETKPAKSLP